MIFIGTYFELGNYTQLHIYIIFFEKKKTYLIIVKSTNTQRSSKFKLVRPRKLGAQLKMGC